MTACTNLHLDISDEASVVDEETCNHWSCWDLQLLCTKSNCKSKPFCCRLLCKKQTIKQCKNATPGIGWILTLFHSSVGSVSNVYYILYISAIHAIMQPVIQTGQHSFLHGCPILLSFGQASSMAKLLIIRSNFNLSSALIYVQILAKLTTFLSASAVLCPLLIS